MFARSGKKGQAIIFENVLIFTVGVAIFIVCYAVFSIYQYTYFDPIGTGDQLESVKDYLSSQIILIAEKDADSSVILDIPTSVGPENYQIVLSTESGLNLTALDSGISKSTPLFGLGESFVMTGAVPSTEGRITLKKTGNQIYIS